MLSNVMKDWLGVCFVTALGLAILIFIPILFDLFEVLQMTKYVVLALFALSSVSYTHLTLPTNSRV